MWNVKLYVTNICTYKVSLENSHCYLFTFLSMTVLHYRVAGVSQSIHPTKSKIIKNGSLVKKKKNM